MSGTRLTLDSVESTAAFVPTTLHLLHSRHQFGRCYFSIAGCCLWTFVAEQCLNVGEVGAGAAQARGE